MSKEYTEKAQKALDLAVKTSRQLHHNYVGTEHLLAGLLREKTSVAANILGENGVELEKLLELIRDLIAPGKQAALAE